MIRRSSAGQAGEDRKNRCIYPIGQFSGLESDFRPCQAVTIGITLTRHAPGEATRKLNQVRIGFAYRGSLVGYQTIISDEGARLGILRPDGSMAPLLPRNRQEPGFLSAAYAALDESSLEELSQLNRDHLKAMVKIWDSNPTVMWNSFTAAFIFPVGNPAWTAPLPDDPKVRGRGTRGN